jgi:hypothetical protein
MHILDIRDPSFDIPAATHRARDGTGVYRSHRLQRDPNGSAVASYATHPGDGVMIGQPLASTRS